MSFYQKYRPKDFESLVWQEFVKTSLQNALKQWKTVWAYLFYGSRGTGKTSVARILARWFNCLNLRSDWNPCSFCKNCISFDNEWLLDVIEIDAASNTWVDNIRDLIEKAQFQPNQSKYKVYIIDEVHMLSKWAFNALLKILEEPPVHVKFILATTEIHKIPETIISRTQRYDFKKISESDVVERLSVIAKAENIDTEKEALKLISRLSKWSLRDAISFLEQYSIWWTLKLEYLRHNLQLVWDEFLIEFVDNLFNKNKEKILNNLDFLREKWVDVKIFLDELIYYIRWKIIESFDTNNFGIYLNIYENFEQSYGKLRYVPNTFILLETTVLKLITWQEEKIEIINKDTDNTIKKINNLWKQWKTEEKLEEDKKSKIKSQKLKEDKKIEKVNIKNDVEIIKNEIKPKKEFDIEVFINNIKWDFWKWFIAMILKSAKFEIKNNNCTFIINNEFNFEKLNNGEIRSYLIQKLKEVFGLDYNIIVELQKQNTEELLKNAEDIF